MVTIHVVGAGSVGVLIAHHLARRGHPVSLLLRSGDRLRHLQARGGRLRVENLHGGTVAAVDESTVSAEVVQPTSGPPIAQLLVTTKANQVADAVRPLLPRLTQDSVVVLLQNGVLGVYEELLAEVFTDQQRRPTILLGSTTHGAFSKAPFHVVHAGQGTCVFGLPVVGTSAPAHNSHPTSGEVSPSAKQMLYTLGELEALRPDVSLTPPAVRRLLLHKLVVNCCLNPLAALLHCRNGGLLGPSAETVVWPAVIQECLAVLGGELEATEQTLLQTVRRVAQDTAPNFNSMLQDVLAGAATEVEYLNGYVVRKGSIRSVATPWNSTLSVLVHAREQCPPHTRTRESLVDAG
eukprot:GGOE01044368.1.p1 GENE.GGOE01044368.1~~GGOE01044368.1.p1  ORF type:complete len:350 (+),score=73.78 GGOE01044368.1:117-1166(+)